uniref:Antitoxin Phd_YefM, type II toxin-antitoxin system n=1 Tax=Candidatus Kentrum sp. FM TaxID=2126340 RepID=A0A450SGX5_9GAMM|nr:MAG: Antitoxin Phd_YefM, type II toxin-antitoxin system [Candidatus Kentron sp. FM]VFJ52357.1 MAG: Antitoxin Phd_YefM, type II toxin-antitoxin system [Candidatus Kentron sp. FM]VFK07724.1 MAG: Antitoxin Phd_YefM, type II toxin-antitoxin system [Candidatus Kentron sp. FM]
MKALGLEHASLNDCVEEARQGRLVITRKGNPVALLIGIDEEQLELGSDASFWRLIEKRREENGISREELERALEAV